MQTDTYNSDFVNEPYAPGQIGPGGTVVQNPYLRPVYIDRQNSTPGSTAPKPYGDYPAVVESPSYSFKRPDGSSYSYGPRGVNGSRSYDEWTEQERALYEETTKLLAAMFAAYSGTTDVERVTFLQTKGRALQARAKFIETRVSALLNAVKQYAPDTEYKTYLGTFTGVLALIPGFKVFGVAASAVAGIVMVKNASENELEFIRRQTQLLDAYKKEYEALSKLVKAVDEELVFLNAETISNAPVPLSTWLYVGGGVAVLLLLIWLRNRKKSTRRK